MERDRPEHVFLVRTWRESGEDDARSAWRGSIQHLASQRRRYFRDLTEICAFILAYRLADETHGADAATNAE